ncbi:MULTISPECIES: hypothetical protein [Mesorhizobium]|uniref:cytidylyltransferase domain-containing protein n=1 Tax=Mesorhizobium TaxID=68287 RepID=UPI0003CEDDBB|nr:MULTISPECIES: hypothetical protein [Mesorhizobium]ESY65909.1 hypothetical protein X742_20405 [Mesorhizobium sp. LNHC232B00]WJI38323.1 hypothetical protein NL534_31520 [Mesorhizobium opportunistum]
MPRNSKPIAIIIAARYASRRFLGKPLARINDLTMINRDLRIPEHVQTFGGDVLMTPATNGTERVLRAAGMLATTPALVLTLQGSRTHWAVDSREAIIDDEGDFLNVQDWPAPASRQYARAPAHSP